MAAAGEHFTQGSHLTEVKGEFAGASQWWVPRREFDNFHGASCQEDQILVKPKTTLARIPLGRGIRQALLRKLGGGMGGQNGRERGKRQE